MITVIIVTAENPTYLRQTLAALSRIAHPCPFKLLVVHNGDDQGTRDAVGELKDRLPLHYVHEPRRGKNYGCNAAIPHIEGELAIFIDDDVIPAEDWLCRMLEAARANPDYDIFGGRIVPLWPRTPEPWILEWVPLGFTYALTAEDQPEGPIAANLVWGPNMAVRPRVFAAGHRFNPAIGPNGTATFIMGSEIEFLERLERVGYRAWHVRSAVVQHVLREHQLDRKWIIARAFRGGRGLYRLERNRGDHGDGSLLADIYRIARPLPREVWRLAQHRLRGDRRLAFRAEWNIAMWSGKLVEAASQLRSNRRGRRSHSAQGEKAVPHVPES
ncbi:MAG TPA: glycosyltransferase [Alphaproteobacteria bacterium]